MDIVKSVPYVMSFCSNFRRWLLQMSLKALKQHSETYAQSCDL